jgi:hypothetical protein
MADTLQKALEAIFRPVAEKPAIVRPVEKETIF